MRGKKVGQRDERLVVNARRPTLGAWGKGVGKRKKKKKKGTKIEEVVGYEMGKKRKKGGKISGRRVKRPIVEYRR